MQMCKAKNASHIRTASTAAAEYSKAKTTNRRLHKIFDTTPSVPPRARCDDVKLTQQFHIITGSRLPATDELRGSSLSKRGTVPAPSIVFPLQRATERSGSIRRAQG